MGEVSQNKVLYVTYKLNRIYKLLTYKSEDIYIGGEIPYMVG